MGYSGSGPCGTVRPALVPLVALVAVVALVALVAVKQGEAGVLRPVAGRSLIRDFL